MERRGLPQEVPCCSTEPVVVGISTVALCGGKTLMRNSGDRGVKVYLPSFEIPNLSLPKSLGPKGTQEQPFEVAYSSLLYPSGPKICWEAELRDSKIFVTKMFQGQNFSHAKTLRLHNEGGNFYVFPATENNFNFYVIPAN